MDKIFISGLIVDAHVGVPDEERRSVQRLLIDVCCETDITAAAKTDDIQEALDYAQIRLFIIQFFKNAHHCLLESIAEKLSALLLEKFIIKKITLSVAKLDIFSDVDRVGVCVERERER